MQHARTITIWTAVTVAVFLLLYLGSEIGAARIDTYTAGL